MDEIDSKAHIERLRQIATNMPGHVDAGDVWDAASNLAALEDENKTLREAVEFYADRQHWRTANSSGAAMNNRGLGLGFHQTGEGQMEVLAANCGQFVVFDNWVHGGHWQADAGHIARAALSNQPTLSKDNNHD